MSRRSASSAMGTRLDAQLNVMCLHIVLFLVGMGSAAVAHPMGPTCFGFGGSGQSCTSALPGDTGKRRGSSLSSKTLAVKVIMTGCSLKPCWLQQIRLGVDRANAAASNAKAGVYLSDGTLMATSESVEVPTGQVEHAWMTFAFRGYNNQLKALAEDDHVWLVVNSEQTVQLTYENVDSEADAARIVSESWPDAFPAFRDWGAEPGRRQWGLIYRNLRMQVDVGDVSVLPGTLPMILEAPHGGRIEEGWPGRVSGPLLPDQNTDLFTEELWKELGERCGGRNPTAVIFRVHRQGCDANRATGNGTVTRADGEPCASQSNGQCCCDIPNDAEIAMDLNDVYHEILAAERNRISRSLLVNIHATGRHRVEIGARLSASDYNEGAALDPPSLEAHNADSSLRVLGEAAAVIWGSVSLGAYLKNNRPDMEVVPSPALLCPDANVCPGSSYESLFAGGHNLKIHVNDTQPGVQMELPQVMRGWGTSPPTPDAGAVKQVAASLAAFLNEHWQETCESDVNFGLTCGAHGQPSFGVCVCDVGYTGKSCSECHDGYQESNGQCLKLVIIGPPVDPQQKYGSAFVASGSGKSYLYTRKFSTNLSDCGAGCVPFQLSLRVRCDSSQCHGDLDDSMYTVGAALYSSAGAQLCNASSGVRAAQGETDWWMDIAFQGCPPLEHGNPEHGAVYAAMWTSKLLKLRWEMEPDPMSGRSKGLQYDTEEFEQNPGAQSTDDLVDALPPAQLPSWIDTDCVSPSGCGASDGCDCIGGCTCRSWTTSGVRHYYGLMATVSMQPS